MGKNLFDKSQLQVLSQTDSEQFVQSASGAGSVCLPLICPIYLHKTWGCVGAHVSLSPPASPNCRFARKLLSNYLLLIRRKDVKEHKTPLSLGKFPCALVFLFNFLLSLFPFSLSSLSVYSLAQTWKMCWHRVGEKLSEYPRAKRGWQGRSCAHVHFIPDHTRSSEASVKTKALKEICVICKDFITTFISELLIKYCYCLVLGQESDEKHSPYAKENPSNDIPFTDLCTLNCNLVQQWFWATHLNCRVRWVFFVVFFTWGLVQHHHPLLNPVINQTYSQTYRCGK